MTVPKKKEKFHFNIGIVAFLLIFVYILGQAFMFMSKEDLAVYEVIQSRIYDSIDTTGLILRDETIVKAKKAGYVNYYVSEGELVSKNGLVYSCDETGEVHKYISNLVQQEKKLSAEDYEDIKEELEDFEERYTDSKFEHIYDLKYNLNNQALKFGDSIMEEHKQDIEKKMGKNRFLKYYSKDHGMVTYVEDGFEGKKYSELTKEDFQIGTYQKKDLKQVEKVSKNDSVYRLITSEKWQIAVLLNENDVKRLEDKTRVTVYLSGGEYKVTCPVKIVKNGEDTIAVLTMYDYLGRFSTERYVDVEIQLSSQNGLKIPDSAIDYKEFYKIPKGYFTGNIASNKALMLKIQDKKGNVFFETVNVDIGRYLKDKDGNEYYYVLKEDLPENALITMKESHETMLLKETEELPGVYNINKGFADFRCVEILMENKDYTIVKQGVSNSIAMFDRIALNGNGVENNEIIY